MFSIPTASTWASSSCSWSLACRFGPCSLQLRDHIFGRCDGNRRSAQVRGLRPRAEQLFNAGPANHDVGVDARRKMNERKNASISDEVCVSATQFETVRFDDFCERLYGAVAWEDRDIDVRRHSHGAMDERGLGTKYVPGRIQRLERSSE